MKKRLSAILPALLISIITEAVSITPTLVAALPAALTECSGLDYSGNNNFWAHNDGYGDNHIYQMNGAGAIIRTVTVNNAINYDWEDLAHDVNRNYLYIGDFGNNNCDRTNLHIYRINHPKNTSLTALNADVINFTYPDQSQFPSPWMNFDAEGFFHHNGLLYIFTKADGSAVGYTKLYTLPDQPGSYVATLVDSFYTNDRITAADINADASAVIISTNSHIHIFTGWSGVNIFSGNHIQVNISGSWTQKEGLAFKDANHVYMADENNGSGNNLYLIDLSTWIVDMSTSIESIVPGAGIHVTAFPNPANDLASFSIQGSKNPNLSIILFDIAGNKVREAKMNEVTGLMNLETADLPSGVYFYRLLENDKAVQTQRLVVSH